MKVKWLLLFLILFWIMGYFREYFFVNLNNIMYIKYYGHSSLPVPHVMAVFNSQSYTTLYYSKYIYTIVWFFLFFLTNYFATKILASEKNLTKFVIYIYLVLLCIAAMSMLYGYFIKSRLQDDEYTLSRWLLGVAQSPIICLILLASEKLYYKTKSPL
jgi:hypothetical protein